MSDTYLEVVSFIERLHRYFLEMVKLELEGNGNPRHQQRASRDVVQRRRHRDDRRRTDLARLLSRNERLLQCEEDGSKRLSRAGALRTRSPLNSRPTDSQGARVTA